MQTLPLHATVYITYILPYICNAHDTVTVNFQKILLNQSCTVLGSVYLMVTVNLQKKKMSLNNSCTMLSK